MVSGSFLQLRSLGGLEADNAGDDNDGDTDVVGMADEAVTATAAAAAAAAAAADA